MTFDLVLSHVVGWMLFVVGLLLCVWGVFDVLFPAREDDEPE